MSSQKRCPECGNTLTVSKGNWVCLGQKWLDPGWQKCGYSEPMPIDQQLRRLPESVAPRLFDE